MIKFELKLPKTNFDWFEVYLFSSIMTSSLMILVAV